MALCRYVLKGLTANARPRWGWVSNGHILPLQDKAVRRCLETPHEEGLTQLDPGPSERAAERIPWQSATLVAPIWSGQEVWAAGVTYESSKFARMAESGQGGDFYAQVYAADRPEIFFKATPHRVVGPNSEVGIRDDSAWNVPEPELCALIAADGRILGYTVGNDMSSRDIEGRNPLYLPQAKVYRACCALGPVIVPASALDPQKAAVRMTITRGGQAAFEGATSTARMRRQVTDLVDWLFRNNEFPGGVFLLTGTGLIPPDDFTLHAADEIAIEIAGIGVLHNTVALCPGG